MLISLHLPKTAGSSFMETLREHYGERFVADYGDRPLHATATVRKLRAARDCVHYAVTGLSDPSAACIHGHFLPFKYRYLGRSGERTFITWMRDPVERLASHYHYWIREYNPATALALQQRVVEESWSLERFCLGPELRNIYGQFLWQFPVQRFDFIGITEAYEDDFRFFCRRFLGEDVAPQSINTNPQRENKAYITDDGLRARIELHHAEDVARYREALRLHERRSA